MKKIILFLLFNTFALFAQDSIKIFNDNFGDDNRVEAVGFIINSSEDEHVKILLKKDNFYQGYHYKGMHEGGEYSKKYLNNIYINAKVSQKLFIYSPAIKTCELEFNVLEFNHETKKAKLSFSASLVGEKRALKTLTKQEFTIKGKEFKRLVKLLKTKTFKMNYQRLTNRLRARLAKDKIKLLRGEITKQEKYISIKFKTNTTFEIVMSADKKNFVTKLSISFKGNKKEEKESAIKIIAATMYILDNKKEKSTKYMRDAKELLQNTPTKLRTKNTQYSINKSNLFEVLPLFNQ